MANRTEAESPFTAAERILKELRNLMPSLKCRYKIRTLGLFGSYRHGATREGSDLDLLVDFEEVPSLFQFVRLRDELTDSLGIPVDLVMRSALKPHIGHRILQDVVYP